jgi:hypothetical protein
MAYIKDHARDYALLLPASIGDYVAADSPVRFVDAFVDDLDLGELHDTLCFMRDDGVHRGCGPTSVATCSSINRNTRPERGYRISRWLYNPTIYATGRDICLD